jgi:hypothetical protein
MSDLPISGLPLSTRGYPDSLIAIVNYNPIATGRTESLPYSAITTYSTTGITTGITLVWNYVYYGVNASSDVTLTLPPTSGYNGYYLIIKDESGNCESNPITINPDTTQLIDGKNSVTMNINYMSLTLIVRNNNWYLI